MGGSVSSIAKAAINPVGAIASKGLGAVGLGGLSKYADPMGSVIGGVSDRISPSAGTAASGGGYGLSRLGGMGVDDNGYQTIGGGINRYGEYRPDTTLMRGADGQLHDNFKLSMSPEYQKLQAKGMTEGDTAAATAAREQQGITDSAARDALARQSGSQLAGGMQNLAMRGGAGSGAQERMNRDISRQAMVGSQNIGQQSRFANLGISQQDEAMKNQLLGQTGMVGQQIQEGNIGRLQQDVGMQNLALQNMYGEDMKALGAQQTAAAQAAAGKTPSLMDKIF